MVLATGFRPDHPWLQGPRLRTRRPDPPVPRGHPRAGPLHVGQWFQHRRDSTFIDGARFGAEDVVSHLCTGEFAALERAEVCMKDYDVVVVGARVAGASTAMLLARAGLRVALLDRGRYGTDTLSTHGLMRAGVLQLSRWGLLDAVVGAGTPPVRRTVFHYARRRARPRSRSDQRGRGRALRAAPVPARPACWSTPPPRPARRAARDPRHRRCSATARAASPASGPGRRRDTRDAHAGFIVGADGIASVVAREVGAAVLKQGRSATAVLYRYFADRRPTATSGRTRRRCRGHDPDQRRTQLRLRRHHPRADARPAPAASRRPSPRCCRGGPAARRAGSRAPAGDPPRLGGRARLRPPLGRSRLGPGRGRGLLQGPDHRARHHRRAARRGAAGRRVLEAMSGARPGAVALAGYEATRDRLSRGLFQVSDEVAAYDWDIAEVPALMRRVSACDDR